MDQFIHIANQEKQNPMKSIGVRFAATVAGAVLVLLSASHSFAGDYDRDDNRRTRCAGLPDHATLTQELKAVVGPGNTGLASDMWASVVNRDGQVCAVTFSGSDRGAQLPAGRVISAQKANTANAFSLPGGSAGVFSGLAVSTANLWAGTQPGGSMFGLQFGNPVDTAVAYGGASHSRGDARKYGTPRDPMTGQFIGGIIVIGGGLALYDQDHKVVGALGLSGDTPCSDHIQAWKVRDALGLDNVPAGISGPGADNIIFDLADDAGGNPESASGFGHPTCLDDVGEKAAAAALPVNYPIGPNP